MMDEVLKKCSMCKERMAPENFYKNRSRYDGLNSHCKKCHSGYRSNRTAKCGDCGSTINYESKLCRTCAHRGDRAVRWKGGRVKTSRGYIMLSGHYDHPNAAKGKILEHILVMSEHLGRPLLPHENVHHRYGVRDDNRIENLELWTRSQPAGQRVEDKVEWAIELLKTYRPEALKEQ